MYLSKRELKGEPVWQGGRGKCLLLTLSLALLGWCAPAQSQERLTAAQYKAVMASSADEIRNYVKGPLPKVLYLCVDWKQTTASNVSVRGSVGAVGGKADVQTLTERAFKRCQALEQEQAQQFPCKCVLADVNNAPPK